MITKPAPKLIQSQTQLDRVVSEVEEMDARILAYRETGVKILAEIETDPKNFDALTTIRAAGITTRRYPLMKLVNKPPRRKMYHVEVDWKYEKNDVLAKFKHAGDAYSYAAKMQDDAWRYGEPLMEIRIDS